MFSSRCTNSFTKFTIFFNVNSLDGGPQIADSNYNAELFYFIIFFRFVAQ